MKTWKERFAELDDGTLLPRTLAELYGNDRLLVERHRGILSYGTECIRVAATYGILTVTGADLRLCCMSRSQLVIRGSIGCVRVEGGN